MIRRVLAVVLSILVAVLWFCHGEQPRGRAQQEGLALDEGFCADSNGDGSVDLSDALSILN